MKALLLNGAPANDPTITALHRVLEGELSAAGWRVEPWFLHGAEIAPCRGCFECWTDTPGECGTDDDGRRVAASLARSRLVVLLTPVTFGGHSSHLKKAVDRLIPDILPFMTKVGGETHHEARYDQRLGLLAIGTLATLDAESELVFLTLTARNAVNFRAERHAAAVLADGAPGPLLERRARSLLEEMGVALADSGAGEPDQSGAEAAG